jgi:hypothetical protein
MALHKFVNAPIKPLELGTFHASHLLWRQIQSKKKGKTLLLKKIVNFANPISTFHRTLWLSNGQKSVTFSDMVQQHYNNQPSTFVKKLTRKLKTKWGVIKHKVSKFVGCHGFIFFLMNLAYSKKTHCKNH